MPLIQEIVLSADIRCSDCQEKIADIMSSMIETYSIVSVLKVTLTCTYSGDRRVSKSKLFSAKSPSSSAEYSLLPGNNNSMPLSLVFAFIIIFFANP
ncbi:hypothetical protein Bca52824_083421 [Brassica carinata]|uniref:HMA domain-containing protein n=1 Tax=Brassica carinata TaxID=52824 RepID=A0A8X7PLC5_BRACI|nr:hypothetical protein Bca52824_083421 [Brassica carinata]